MRRRRRLAEHRTQSGLEIVDHGEFPLDRANHLRAHPQTAGGTQQLEAAMQGVGESAYREGCQQSDTNMANVANAMSRMSRPGRQQGRMAAPRASFRRDSQETDQRPLARTPQSPGVDSGNWRLGAAKLHVVSAAATDRATRDALDKHAPMGRAARAVEGRVLARPCCACTRRSTRSWSRRSNRTWCRTCCNWGWCRKRPPT